MARENNDVRQDLYDKAKGIYKEWNSAHDRLVDHVDTAHGDDEDFDINELGPKGSCTTCDGMSDKVARLGKSLDEAYDRYEEHKRSH